VVATPPGQALAAHLGPAPRKQTADGPCKGLQDVLVRIARAVCIRGARQQVPKPRPVTTGTRQAEGARLQWLGAAMGEGASSTYCWPLPALTPIKCPSQALRAQVSDVAQDLPAPQTEQHCQRHAATMWALAPRPPCSGRRARAELGRRSSLGHGEHLVILRMRSLVALLPIDLWRPAKRMKRSAVTADTSLFSMSWRHLILISRSRYCNKFCRSSSRSRFRLGAAIPTTPQR